MAKQYNNCRICGIKRFLNQDSVCKHCVREGRI